jgi:SAM-dependent methyltransferase
MALIDDTDKSWEYYGKHDPYYGVFTSDEYHAEHLTEASKEQFFETGRKYIDSIVATVRRHLDHDFSPVRALDFGCGVGRLVIPLAAVCETVTGVDVSESMLNEARNNCVRRGLKNVSLVLSDDNLSQVSGSFNFINSYLVFQHIPPHRGERIFAALADRLEEGGVGSVHVTYLRKSTILKRFVHWGRKTMPLFNGLVNIAVLRKPFSYPMIQMNEYNLERLFSLLQERHCHQAYVWFSTQAAGDTTTHSITIFFRKQAKDDQMA